MTEFLTEWQISSFDEKSWPFEGSGLLLALFDL